MILAYPNYADESVSYTPTYSNGSWLAALPLSNIADTRLAKVARSSDATAASSKLDINLGVSRTARVIAVLLPNITTAATIQAKYSTVSDFSSTAYDSGSVAAWPSGIDAEESEGTNVWTTLVMSSAQSGQYVRIEITDTSNPDAYIDVARVIVAAGWQPTINAEYGLQLGLDTASLSTDSDGGATIHDRRPVRRTAQFVINNLPEAEAFANAFDLQRLAGTDRQIHFVYDPDDTTQMWRRSFLVTLRELTALDIPSASYWGVPFQLREVL